MRRWYTLNACLRTFFSLLPESMLNDWERVPISCATPRSMFVAVAHVLEIFFDTQALADEMPYCSAHRRSRSGSSFPSAPRLPSTSAFHAQYSPSLVSAYEA